MLYYGNSRNIQDQCVIFNFTSYIEGYRRLPLLPPNNLGAVNEYHFDCLYMQYIISDDMRFSILFSLVSLLHQGTDVYLIISEDDWSEVLIESLLKLIQQRYGYNAIRINCFDDIVYSQDSVDFIPAYGVINYDADLTRYESILIRNGAKIDYE